MKLTNSNGTLTKQAVQEILEHAPDTTCECPRHLVNILKSVRDFTEYQKKCIKEKPSDIYIHEWLETSSVTVDALLSGIILQLSYLEGIIDTKTNKIRKLAPTGIKKSKKRSNTKRK